MLELEKKKEPKYSEDVEKLLKADVVIEEPDRGIVKYPKYKYKLSKRRYSIPFRSARPPKESYHDVLRNSGRNLRICEACGSEAHITVHHKDGNPFNNELENLSVLCWDCHKALHFGFEDYGVREDEEGVLDEDF